MAFSHLRYSHIDVGACSGQGMQSSALKLPQSCPISINSVETMLLQLLVETHQIYGTMLFISYVSALAATSIQLGCYCITITSDLLDLPFLYLEGNRTYLSSVAEDSVSIPVQIQGGFPFGNSNQSSVYVWISSQLNVYLSPCSYIHDM